MENVPAPRTSAVGPTQVFVIAAAITERAALPVQTYSSRKRGRGGESCGR